jgi:hypothetical protein
VAILIYYNFDSFNQYNEFWIMIYYEKCNY